VVLRLAFAIPDHPWADIELGANVRVAMTVGAAGAGEGRLLTVAEEEETGEDARRVVLREQVGTIHADMTAGAKVVAAVPLRANAGLCFQGMNLVGKGFRLTPQDVRSLGYDAAALPPEIKPHRNARDMMQGGEDCFVIDLFGLTADEARARHPALYQWLFDRVKPERDHNKDAQRRRDWWLFGRSNRDLRRSWVGLSRMVLTPETSKHRVFAFQELPFCPDHKLYAVCSADAWVLGVSSSSIHAVWALTAGGTLEDRPTWTNTTCFLPFPFPAATPAQQTRIRELAEQLDAHRKHRQAAHPELTLTGLYNVLEKLKAGDALTAKDRLIHEQGLVAVLKSLHDELDRAVLAAYGWDEFAPLLEVANGNCRAESAGQPDRAAALRALDAALLERLVALNAERTAEEARGLVRWLRPEFQHPQAAPRQDNIEVEGEAAAATLTPGPALGGRGEKLPWPETLPEQVATVASPLAESPVPLDADAIAARHTGRGPWKKRLPQLLDTLVALGRARQVPSGYTAAP
jgi:hypothetical protein